MVLDKLGQEIKVGSIICYSTLLGRSAGLKFGKVIKIKSTPSTKREWNGLKKIPETIGFIDTKLIVRGIEEWFDDIPRLNSSTGILLYPESRVIVISENQISEKYKVLLDTIKVNLLDI